MSKIVKSVGKALGFGGESSANNAMYAQLDAGNKQIEFQKESRDLARADLAPFAQFGQQQLPGLQSLMTQDGQNSYLENNPMFQAAIRQSTLGANASAAASGRANSGGLVNELFQNYLAQGDNYINSQFSRLMSGANMGQASAAGQANNAMASGQMIGNAIGNQGDIRAAGLMAKQNAAANLGGNLLGGAGGAMLGSGMLGGAGIAGGGAVGGGIGALLGLSDRKYKKDIRKVGEDKNGNVYEFSYLWGGKYRGRLADELVKYRPDAVKEVDGALMVTPEFAPKRVA